MSIVAILFMFFFVVDPFEHVADFEMSDFYLRTSARMRPTVLSKDIVILSVDHLSRPGIAKAVERADFLGASAVALDVFFNGDTEYDNDIAEALSSCEHLVLPSSLTESFYSPVFDKLKDTPRGFTNLECKKDGGIIRSFRVEQAGNFSLPAIASGKTCSRDGIIRYDGVEFDILLPEQMTEKDVAGKIVFVGNVNDFSDCHSTPMGTMSGVVIQAYICQTLISGNAPKEWPGWLMFIIAYIIEVIVLLCYIRISDIDEENPDVGGDLADMAIRFGQILLLVLLYMSGVAIFVYFGNYADFSLSLLMVAAALFVFDMVKGCKAIKQLYLKRKNNKMRNKSVE